MRRIASTLPTLVTPLESRRAHGRAGRSLFINSFLFGLLLGNSIRHVADVVTAVLPVDFCALFSEAIKILVNSILSFTIHIKMLIIDGRFDFGAIVLDVRN